MDIQMTALQWKHVGAYNTYVRHAFKHFIVKCMNMQIIYKTFSHMSCLALSTLIIELKTCSHECKEEYKKNSL